jgi:hypothetical protein
MDGPSLVVARTDRPCLPPLLLPVQAKNFENYGRDLCRLPGSRIQTGHGQIDYNFHCTHQDLVQERLHFLVLGKPMPQTAAD